MTSFLAKYKIFILIPILALMSFTFAPEYVGKLLKKQKQTYDTITYLVDTLKSKINWRCDVHRGYVLLKSGEIKVVNNEVVAGYVIVKMDSIIDEDIDYELMRLTLQNVLKSETFFDVKNYPETKFLIDHSGKTTDSTFFVQGDLMILGIVNCVGFNYQINFQGDNLIIHSDEFNINRLYWGITSYSQHVANSDKSYIVSDEIDFVIHLTAQKKR